MLKILLNIGEHRGVASVGEHAGEMIRAISGIQKFTAPLGVASVPLQL